MEEFRYAKKDEQVKKIDRYTAVSMIIFDALILMVVVLSYLQNNRTLAYLLGMAVVMVVTCVTTFICMLKDAGRGFAVVADQIRELSEKTRVETESIAQILDKLTTNADQTAKAVEKSVSVSDVQDSMINEVVEKVDELTNNVDSLVKRYR